MGQSIGVEMLRPLITMNIRLKVFRTLCGGEFISTIDATAEKITKDESYFQGAVRGFNAKPPREIWLNYTEKEKMD